MPATRRSSDISPTATVSHPLVSEPGAITGISSVREYIRG